MAQEYYDPWSNTRTKNGLEADLVISAMQKCIRRAEEETALRMAYELYITSTSKQAGEAAARSEASVQAAREIAQREVEEWRIISAMAPQSRRSIPNIWKLKKVPPGVSLPPL